MKWHELDKTRLVLEFERIKKFYPSFQICKDEDNIAWEGAVSLIPEGINEPPLRIRIILGEGFPVVAPKIKPISPEIPEEVWGHQWHRWEDGYLCYVKPHLWKVVYHITDIIEKAEMWYFNYLAYKHKLVDKMPDSGFAIL